MPQARTKHAQSKRKISALGPGPMWNSLGMESQLKEKSRKISKEKIVSK